MRSLLVLDDSAVVNDLFAGLLRDRLDVDVVPLAAVAELEAELERHGRFDVALVDLSFPEERTNGLDAMLMIHAHHPDTVLAVITQGDAYVSELLRDVWELLPVASVISKSAPLEFQIGQVRDLLETGSAVIDPSVQPMLPSQRSAWRTLDGFARLVPHLGFAKIWEALFVAPEDVTYRFVTDATGLRLNTVKNYRAHLLPELAAHGMRDPSLREMRDFAVRCRPVLARCIADHRARSARPEVDR
jgi:DNA-binding NarL/FixJ family response regulator